MDVAAECIVRLLDEDISIGRTYHVTAGRENLITVRDFLKTAMQWYGSSPVPPLRFTSAEAGHGQRQKALASFFEYLSFHKEFDDSCLRSDLGESLPPRPHPTAYLGSLLDFCRLTRWGTGTSWEDMKCAS